jgi:hypothetical protein
MLTFNDLESILKSEYEDSVFISATKSTHLDELKQILQNIRKFKKI